MLIHSADQPLSPVGGPRRGCGLGKIPLWRFFPMRIFLNYIGLILLALFIAGCSPAIPSQTEISEPAKPLSIASTDQNQTPTSALLSIVTVTGMSLPAPIPNDFGLTIEENVIFGQEHYETVLKRHAQEKEKPYKNILPDPINGNSPFKAFLGLQAGDQVKVFLQQNGITVFEIDGGDTSPIEPLRGLWGDQDHWILEIAFVTNKIEGNIVYSNPVGQIYRDGTLLNELFGYEEMFGYQLIDDKPFYFYKKDGRIHLSFNDEDLPITYDEIIHYRCCSGAEKNPVAAGNWVGFWGLRDGVWYYTEIGRY